MTLTANPYSPYLLGGPITTSYGAPSAFTGEPHPGVDFGLPPGTKIPEPVGGRVERITYDSTGGLQVVIRTANGYAETFAHLLAALVNVGDEVDPGTIIGASGASGHVTGPHLHYQVNAPSGGPLDPAVFLGEFGGALLASVGGAPLGPGRPGTPTSPAAIQCAMLLTFSALPKPALAAITGIPEAELQTYAYACARASGQKSGVEAFVAATGNVLFNPANWAKLAFSVVGVALIVGGAAMYLGSMRGSS